MPVARRSLVIPLVIVTLCLAASAVLAYGGKKERKNSSATRMEEQKRAVHALNRLAFGPRPGDVQRVSAMGVDKWIEQQLHPEKIDDSATEARLAPFRTLRMNTREMLENFPPPQVIRAVAEGKQGLPHDPAKRAVYEAQLERYQDKQAKKREAAANNSTATSGDAAAGGAGEAQTSSADDDAIARRREAKLYADLKAQELLDLPPDQRMKEILKMTPEERREVANVKGDERDSLMEGMSPQQRETLMAIKNPQQVVVDELAQAKLLRAIYSERPLDEVMADFWFNHFNVFVNKGADRYLLTSYERDVIRPHAL